MRVLVATTWFPDTAAPSRAPFCLEHALAASDAGHDVVVVHLDRDLPRGPARTERYAGLEVVRVPLTLRSPRGLVAVTRLLARRLRDADVLHTMAFSTVLVCAPAWLRRRTGWVHTEHWNGVTRPGTVGRAWSAVAFLRHVLQLPHVVTGVTEELVTAMARFSRPGAARVVPCVVEPPRTVVPTPPAPPLALVGVGHLIERKDPLLAVRVVDRLVRRGHDVRLTWVGTGPLEREVLELVEGLGLTERVHLSGAVPPDAVGGYLSAAHLFLVPTHQENFFTAAAEAICHGRPVVLPSSGGYTEYCTEANSVLVEGFDVDVLADAVETAQERFAGIPAEQVAATLGDRFASRRVGAVLGDLYREVAEQQAPT